MCALILDRRPARRPSRHGSRRRTHLRRRSLASVSLAIAVACLVASLPPAASGQVQPIAASNGEDAASATTEEVIVHGDKPLRVLRLEAEQARERVYELFNQHNPDDRLHIRCTSELRPGSRIKHRVCRGAYVDEATHRAGSRVAQSLQEACPQGLDRCEDWTGGAEAVHNNATSIFQEEYTVIHQLNPKLASKMHQLVLEVPEITVAFAEYLDKEQEYRKARQQSAR